MNYNGSYPFMFFVAGASPHQIESVEEKSNKLSISEDDEGWTISFQNLGIWSEFSCTVVHYDSYLELMLDWSNIYEISCSLMMR